MKLFLPSSIGISGSTGISSTSARSLGGSDAELVCLGIDSCTPLVAESWWAKEIRDTVSTGLAGGGYLALCLVSSSSCVFLAALGLNSLSTMVSTKWNTLNLITYYLVQVILKIKHFWKTWVLHTGIYKLILSITFTEVYIMPMMSIILENWFQI